MPGARWGCPAPPALIAGIGPEPGGLGLSGAGREHLDGRIIGEDCLGRQDMATDGLGQRFQQSGGLADPAGQRGTVEIKAFAVEDLALAVKLQVSAYLRPAHGRANPGRGLPRLIGREAAGPGEAFAAGASQPGPYDPVHDEAARDIF